MRDDSQRFTMPPLSAAEARVILNKETEPPFSGDFWNNFAPGEYHCRQCGALLYPSGTKFRSSCGWPSFDDALLGAVRQVPDADGLRTEILCASCGGHLGHIFTDEGLTPKNVRHCVNSLSLAFTPESEEQRDTLQISVPEPIRQSFEVAIFAGGCFWGIEHQLQQEAGVLSVTSGYTGGHTENPTYDEVCSGITGHAEAVQVVFDPARVSYEHLARLFFELHDPTQVDRQGPDRGTQYRSAVFYTSRAQQAVIMKLMDELTHNGYMLATQVLPAGRFYPAEEYHQRFFSKHPGRAFCHTRVKRFDHSRFP